MKCQMLFSGKAIGDNCMKCQILFSRKNKKTIINWLSTELSQSVVKVKPFKIQSNLSFLVTCFKQSPIFKGHLFFFCFFFLFFCCCFFRKKVQINQY